MRIFYIEQKNNPSFFLTFTNVNTHKLTINYKIDSYNVSKM